MIKFSENFKIYVLPWISLAICMHIAWAFYKHILCAFHDKFVIRRIIAKKRKEREHAFQKLESRYEMDSKAASIVELSEDQLLIELRKRRLTASEVLDAFIAKALKETKEFNSVTEFIPQAHIWAAQLDEMKEIKGPLHGLPISVKDNINVEGMDSTLGFAKFVHKPEATNANIVKALMDLGAVPFCKTNVPQSLFNWGCGNPVFGETKNPLNPILGPGGSSGGEASLIASGGSAFGIGSDVGGSCRIPAHFCGISGFKPTKMRLSPHGFKSTVTGLVGLNGVPGLLSKSVDLIAKVFKELTMPDVQEKFDQLVVPITWNEKIYTSVKPLRIGYFTSLAYLPVIGDTEQIVLSAKEALESEGHTLVPFEMPDSFTMARLIADFAYADGGENSLKIWKDEPVAQSAIFHYLMCRIPRYGRRVLAAIMECKYIRAFHSTRVATFFRGGALQSKELWDSMEMRRKMLVEISSEWERLKLDLILCPAFPFPALPISAAGKLKPAVIYTMIWNMFDFPAGVVKFGTESGEFIAGYDSEGDFFLEMAKKGAKESKGMPVAVQIVGLPFHEEVVLRGMREIESLRIARA